MRLYDYIYVDLEKAISLYSQLTGGVVELRESQVSKGKTSDNKRAYDFKILKHNAGGSITDTDNVKEVIKPYHSFLIDLEQTLENQKFLTAFGLSPEGPSLRDPQFRKAISDGFAIKVTGRCVIEDYGRIKRVSMAFPKITEMIKKSNEASIKKSDEYKEFERHMAEAEQQAKSIKDKNRRNEANLLVKRQKQALADLIASQPKIEAPEGWILDALQTWIDTFLPGIVNLRVYPYQNRPDEQVFGHLKKECFCDDDAESIHFTYGSKPSSELTLLGIVTSVPGDQDDGFNPLIEFNEQKSLTDEETVEKGFRSVFRGFDGFEQMIRTCRYPRIVVYPVLVYRTAMPNITSSSS